MNSEKNEILLLIEKLSFTKLQYFYVEKRCSLGSSSVTHDNIIRDDLLILKLLIYFLVIL